MNYRSNIDELNNNGFSIIEDFYSNGEIAEMLNCFVNTNDENPSFLKTKDLFAVRKLIKNIPELTEILFNSNFERLLSDLSDTEFFLTKAIYFDKPVESNWFVPYHQDLSISVNTKIDSKSYSNWTFKRNIYGVQPPVEILQDTFTVRIHLDETNLNNGALKVIPKSHLDGILRKETMNINFEREHVCNVRKGGIMLMKPLLLHASSRTSNGKRRRVIHLEFNKHSLETPLEWLEYVKLNWNTD